MNKSESIAKLVEALSKLQGEIQNLHKDKQGYGYKYTELASILDVTRPLCAKYELAVTQLCCNPEDVNCVGVETVLAHASGEWVSSVLYMNITAGKGMSPAQAAGSVITYARRYALAATLGIAQTDDDASIKEVKPEIKEYSYPLLLAIIKDRKLEDRVAKWCEYFRVQTLDQLGPDQVKQLTDGIEEIK